MNQDFKDKFKINDLNLIEFKHWMVSVRPVQVNIGSLIISLKRDCAELNLMTSEETAELSLVFSKTENLLKEAFHYDKINYLALMMVDTQVHFHVIPRFENPVIFENKKYIDKAWPAPVDILESIDDESITAAVYDFLRVKAKQQKPIVGYTTGVYDLFHIGHLNILKKAKEYCDYLIVGVTTDELVSYKNTKSIIPFEERLKIVEGIKYVDKVVAQRNMDKMAAWEDLKFDRMFVGSDWRGTDKWNKFEEDFAKIDVEIIYFSYTDGTSSTHLKEVLDKILNQ